MISHVKSHVTRCVIAGVVALLPIGGTILTVGYLETEIGDSGLKNQPWYFPGLGLLGAGLIIYSIGLVLTTFIGRMIWGFFDRTMDKLPLLGPLYQTLKQIAGYSEGKDAVFEKVVLMDTKDYNGKEIAFVTRTIERDDGPTNYLVFVPAAPTPSSGRLILVPESELEILDISVHEGLKTLVALGKLDMKEIEKVTKGHEVDG